MARARLHLRSIDRENSLKVKCASWISFVSKGIRARRVAKRSKATLTPTEQLWVLVFFSARVLAPADSCGTMPMSRDKWLVPGQGNWLMTLDHHIALGTWLRQQRELAGLNIRDAAERLEMSKTKLSRIETGQTQPLTLDEIDALCDAYGVDGETKNRVRSSLPTQQAKLDLVLLSMEKPALIARIGAVLPWMIGHNCVVVVDHLARNAIENLPAIRAWLDSTDIDNTELFINQSSELSEVSALREYLRACSETRAIQAESRRRYAAALAILDTAWMAEQTDADDLIESIRSACVILAPELEHMNE